jgi:adenylate cyclase
MANHENETYEVQVFNQGRWQVYGRYNFHERTLAVQEAKELAQERKALPVRVILEDYNPKTGRHEEILIYRNKVDTTQAPARANNQRKWADMSVTSDGRVGFFSDDDDTYGGGSPRIRKAKGPVSTSQFFTISIMILIISLGCGALSAVTLSFLLNGFDIALAHNARKSLLAGIFIFMALISAISSFQYYAARYDLNLFKSKKKEPVKAKKNLITTEMEKAAIAIDKTPVVEKPIEPESNDSEFESIEIQEDDDDLEEEFSENAEHQKMFLITFLGNCLGALKGLDANSNTLNRFAINLFMIGAVVSKAKEHDLTGLETNTILQRILEMLGTKTVQAEKLTYEYEKYLTEPRHMELYEAGARIASLFSEGDQSAPLHIQDVITKWSAWIPPIVENSNPFLLTIMFTDMVGSTDLTSTHGDYAAQEVLKAHDLIVRTALTNFEGKEIKHLGDGIMASFKNHNRALAAAIEIQKRVAGNNNSGPEFPLHVRIGINSGEPIRKDNDLFGSSVQLAARLCDKAGSDSILVSQDLRDLCDERSPFTFIDAGQQTLKGFKEPVTTYQIDWSAPAIVYIEPEQETEPEPVTAPITENIETEQVTFPADEPKTV